MRFKTQTLIETIDAEIERRKAVAETAFQSAVAEYDQAKAEWLASKHPEAIKDTARRLLEKVRKGRVVTADDVKPIAERWGNKHTFDEIEPKRETKGRRANIQTLTDLREFLTAVADDEVTSSGLRDVGFRNIAQILREAVQ